MALTHLEERILIKIGRHSVAISEIEDGFFHTDRPPRIKIFRILQKLVKQKIIVKTGTGRGTRYEKVKT